MIISHLYKVIFLKTEKTAGTSIEIALSRFCGPEDIITPISPEDEEMRKRLGYPGPQNYFLSISSYGFYDAAKWLINRKRKSLYNHINGNEVKAYIGEQMWNSYYKFAVERKPWDRCISLYYYRYRYASKPRPTISEFISSNELLTLKKRGYEIYTIDGWLAVDKICAFENLSYDLEEVRKKVGIPEKLELPKAKAKFRKDKRHYRDILEEADGARIAEIFHNEISLFGYEW